MVVKVGGGMGRLDSGTASGRREAIWLDLGHAAYGRVHELQMKLHSLRQEDRIPDVVVVVEHLPCITFGRAACLEHIVASAQDLRAAGIDVISTDRGGDVTYHGPGQLVVYPIVDLRSYGKDVHAHARRLEAVLIDTAGALGVETHRRPGFPGVWTERGKVGALGIKVKRWISLHGVSLNVSPDMSHFDLIVPCGIHDRGVTSLADELGRPLSPESVMPVLRGAFEEVFEVRLVKADLAALGG
jgi:lipoyl(octanoyl) transferase